METFHKRIEIPGTPEQLWKWHASKGAFRRLMPPWQKLTVLAFPDALTEGSEVHMQLHLGPFRKRWDARHTFVAEGAVFVDEQVRGPFASWKHRHSFLPAEAREDSSAILEDFVQYRLPLGRLGSALGGGFVKGELSRLFRYRHEVTRLDFERLIPMTEDSKKMRILVSGASGLVGSKLTAVLQTLGHTVVPLTRSADNDDEVEWSVEEGQLEAEALEGVDAVVHLAGETLTDGRWTDEKKKRILESRRDGTRLLCQTLASLERKPKVLVCASGINYYPMDGNAYDESGRKGDSFLSDVCQQWEEQTEIARDAGIRVVNLRISVVLTPEGGALGKLLPVFKTGAGGPAGSGDQHMSWIAIDDLTDLIAYSIHHDKVNGVVNAVAPEVITNREFSKTLGRVLSRPAFIPAPAVALKLALGQMAEETVLADLNIVSSKLKDYGFSFRYPKLEPALRHMLGK